MLTRDENDLLTRVGPCTPGGELLRRYWQPVALSEEIPPGAPPVPLGILGEDLTLFRDESGRLGLLDIHCAHRAADLSYGRLEDGGLRCLYHGWLFDVEGHCLDQPGEPEGSKFKDKVRQTAYPCLEKAGIVFAYMGSGEPPLLPAYDFLNAPDDHTWATKFFSECSYLQGNEGNIDPQHLSFLHKAMRETAGFGGRAFPTVRGGDRSANRFFGDVPAPTIDIEETDFGLRIYSVRDEGDGREYVRITNFIYPNLAAFPGGGPNGDGYSVNWHVPIDDTHHWKFNILFSRGKPLDKAAMLRGQQEWLDAGYRPKRSQANRYLQSRASMQTEWFTGMGPAFPVHDFFATETQGPIQDRTQEHLGYTDKAIAAQRKLLLRAVRQVQEGAEPPHVIRRTQDNRLSHLGAYGAVIQKGADWASLWREREGVTP